MSNATQPSRLPDISGSVPGAISSALADRLARVESRNVTYRSESFPIFWDQARGSNVWDVDGNRYVDLTAGFGVAATGHAHPKIVAAIQKQAERLVHGMGDVHPPSAKVQLLDRLAGVVPMADVRSVLCTSGSEAVEIALKTACLATGKPGVLAFTGAYHGLTYGALSVTDRALFRGPFEAQLNPHVVRVDFPHPYRVPARLTQLARDEDAPRSTGSKRLPVDADDAESGAWLTRAALRAVEHSLDDAEGEHIGAIIVEPVQGRGGEVVPPAGFLSGLEKLCRSRSLLLILDEIYTGFGRTGSWFACQAEGVEPDLLCVGKAFSGAMPIAACVGQRESMDAWPESRGEAMHTTTFLGHPIACAAASAAIEIIAEEELVQRAAELGRWWQDHLRNALDHHPWVGDVRGRGLMMAIDLVSDRFSKRPDRALGQYVVKSCLRSGWIVLPSGPDGNVISFSPALDIGQELLEAATEMLDEVFTKARLRDPDRTP
jgi:4-aminobutyrate aminotransferase-like enzyme